MRRLLLALVVSLFAVPAAGAGLTIMAEDASEPFSRADGSGYANDVVRAAFKAAGIDVRLDIVPYARCKQSLVQGTTPACFAMSWTPEFKGKIVFSDRPIYEVYADIFRNAKAPVKITRAEDLRKGDVVGIVNGYEYPAAVANLATRGVVLQNGINEVSLLKMLANRRLDAVVAMTNDFIDAPNRLRAAGVADSVAPAFRGGLLQSYIGFSLKNPQGEAARAAFNRGYDIITRNGTRAKIRDKWVKAVGR